jgi:UDP-N-acetyl-2-amino-2-deoxyglucuronate dehydrogenase
MTLHHAGPIRFGVVGYGHIGKRHAEMIKGHPRCALGAVADTNASLKAHVDEHHGVPFHESVEDLLAAHPDLDVICVCTPNALHAPHSQLALEHRKHVVCEKPMGLSKADCEQVIHKALQVSRHVFCVMQNRYSPPSVWLKELVDSGKLGRIYTVHINCYWNRDDRYYAHSDWKGTINLDGGPLFTQFSHFIDIMYWLFGDIDDVHARFHNFNHAHNTEFEDSGQVNFRFRNGGLGSINYSTSVWDRNLESSMTIVAEKGSVKVGGQYMEQVEVCHVDGYTMPELPPANPPNDYGPYKGSAANHSYIFENVVETLEGGGMATTNALEGLKVVEIIERIYATRPLPWPR